MADTAPSAGLEQEARELLAELDEAIEASRDRNGDMLYFGPPDPLLVKLRAALAQTRSDCGKEAALEDAARALEGIEPDEEAAGGPASWGDFVQIAQSVIRNLKANAGEAGR